jgi:hypothetical protein
MGNSLTPPVTVEQGGLTVTTNTASEADLRAELARDQPPADVPQASAPDAAAAPAGDAAAAPPPARNEKGQFVKKADAPVEVAPPAPSEPAPDPEAAPARRRDDSLPRHDRIARMNRALQQKAEAERRAAQLEAELLRYRQALAPAAPPASAPPAPPSATNGHGEPQFEQFADQPDPYTAYVQAWARWDNARQVEERFARYEQAQAEKAREQAFTSHLQQGRTAYADFDQRLTEADTLGLQVSAVMREAIADSPKAADLVYYLATHPEECTQLALESETTPVAAATVMRRLLESHLAPRAVSPTGNGAAAKAPASTAKPPIQPVGSSPVVSDDPPGESASAAEHARYWNRRLKVPGTR